MIFALDKGQLRLIWFQQLKSDAFPVHILRCSPFFIARSAINKRGLEASICRKLTWRKTKPDLRSLINPATAKQFDASVLMMIHVSR